jgi:TetR/AcrR family transcriptional regulator
MARTKQKSSRRQQILESLVSMLEANPGGRITTASLAREVGVSEAALYRHFPSKFKMYEGLIDFIEVTVFTRITRILQEETSCWLRTERILSLVLSFADRNPGISRILTGDALVGENQRLHRRIVQFYDRLETQLKQILREAEIQEGIRPPGSVSACANLLVACVEGRIVQFVRSEFRRRPTEYWADQWVLLTSGLLQPAVEGVNPGSAPHRDSDSAATAASYAMAKLQP